MILKTNMDTLIKESWKKISPFWPLKNLIAVNPLQGFEDLTIEEALLEAAVHFQQPSLPEAMQRVNRETIKWLQAFFDEGQSTISMPNRRLGLYNAWLELAPFDKRLHQRDKNQLQWLASLPKSSVAMIAQGLLKLNIPPEEQADFLSLLLTTLPGWAAHIQYRTTWTSSDAHPYPVTQADYLAMRLVITYLLWPDARNLLKWYRRNQMKATKKSISLDAITEAEKHYSIPLLNKIISEKNSQRDIPSAQLIFCIDTRSEPFRRAIEAQGDYETFGFAGFFGIPLRIENKLTGESYASCPVLIQTKHIVKEFPDCTHTTPHQATAGYARGVMLKKLYQSVKYTFSTPFVLAEALGMASGLWMGLRTIFPEFSMRLKNTIAQKISPSATMAQSIDIPLSDQCAYAEAALKIIGLTKNFAPLIVLCGHGSSTQNNAYATALDCGACGGRHGISNARVMAVILNNPVVRDYLKKKNMDITEGTQFIAGQHNTSTDAVELYPTDITNSLAAESIQILKNDLDAARKFNSQWRAQEMGFKGSENQSANYTHLRSKDWAQVRPEWGLARNAAFIISPRALTKNIDLEGRSFLHSYDYTQDPDGVSLRTILTAPVIVAQWINTQYLFSSLDNVAYGSGSKITQNITGKIGVMQGNASDLMHGLPLQSLYKTDTVSYHQALRLLTVIYAPRHLIDSIITTEKMLQSLFKNAWINLVCIEPTEKEYYFLQRNLSWDKKSG